MPIRTPRLLLRPKQPGDGAPTAQAVAETWADLHQWMDWAKSLQDNTAEKQEIRTRQVMAKFLLREELNLLGIERATGKPVLWTGFHNLNWNAGQCEVGYWVRKSAQGRGYATEATNALLRYAFQALAMRRVGISHAAGNEPSRRIIEKLGFRPEGIQRSSMQLPGDHLVDRHLYARLDITDLPALDVSWGTPAAGESADDLAAHLRSLEERLLDPDVRAQPEAVAALLTRSFREFGSSGRTFTRDQILAELANETRQELVLTDFHIDQLDPASALVTYRSHRRTPDGNTISALRSSQWILEPDGHWRMHFHQGTRQP